MKGNSAMKKAIPAALIMAGAMGMSTNASAAAYAISYDNVFNLAVLSSPFVPLSDFQTFTATTSVGANLNGVSNSSGNPPNSMGAGGPVDAAITWGEGSVFTGGNPVNNAFTAKGMSGNYSYGDAQISATSLRQDSIGAPVVLGDGTTQAWNIAEGYIAGNGTADAAGLNGSVTGFNSDLNLQEATAFTFSFNADPYMEVLMSADALGGSANANLDVTFTITQIINGQGTTVFEWTPDGVVGSGIVNGVEAADAFNLNGSIEVTAPGDTAVFDPCGNGTPDGNIARGCANGSNFFSATTGLLAAGRYNISIDMVENIDIRTAVPVPQPGILALFGLALAGLGASRRRK